MDSRRTRRTATDGDGGERLTAPRRHMTLLAYLLAQPASYTQRTLQGLNLDPSTPLVDQLPAVARWRHLAHADARAERLAQRHADARHNPPPYETRKQLRSRTLAIGRRATAPR